MYNMQENYEKKIDSLQEQIKKQSQEMKRMKSTKISNQNH